MDIFFHRYAELIVKNALKLKPGDVLSINTEEKHSKFAHLVADIARRSTGNGSYIQIIEKGKVADVEEASTDYPIGKKPTALLYLQTYSGYPETEEHKLYSAPELQTFRLLAEPLGNPTPVLPFATAPVPSEAWGKVLEEEDGNESLVCQLFYDLFSLGEDEYADIFSSREEIISYECEKLNKIKLNKARIVNEEGTDLTLEFLAGSEFKTSIETTTSGKKFIPSIFSSDIFRALDKTKTSGYLNITHPIILFGSKINNLSLSFENGRITSFDADISNGKLLNLYLEQDPQAGVASMLTIAEDTNPASLVELTAYPEWDRMRGVSITVGSPKSNSVDGDLADKANDSIVSLSLSIGSDSTTITLFDVDGNEYMIFEDGIILEED